MNGYKVKNYFWLLIILTALVILMSGCSSSPKVADAGSQYCYNNKTITVKNGQDVTSESVTTCSDDKIGKLVDVRAGLAKNCNYAKINIRRGNEYVPRKVVLCKDHDGDTHVLFSTVVR
jgi:uncharacterized protein YceK